MPSSLSYPGVYIEEVPGGSRSIAGVATSVTAFIGRAPRGPTHEPVLVGSYGEFERVFGGLWRASPLGYAVRAYFQNGGGQAAIVRIYRKKDGEAERAAVRVQGLTLAAASEGAWGTALRARVDHEVAAEVAARLGVAADALFNLTITDGAAVEVHRNLTLAESPRQIGRVLEAESTLVRFVAADAMNVARPPAGADDVSVAEKSGDPAALATARAAAAASDGAPLSAADFSPPGAAAGKRGLYALDKLDLFNLLSIPPHTFDGDVEPALWAEAAAYCEGRRAILLVDPPRAWTSAGAAQAGLAALGVRSKNAALYFPRLRQADPLASGQLIELAPAGAVAGVIARVDAERGLWKAPAGTDATLVGVAQLAVGLTDRDVGLVNPLGVNCLRDLPAAGRVVWGARTCQGDDRLASEWKYLPVRRLALHLEESLYRGTQWVVFEPNDEPLWSQIRLSVGAFLDGLFRQGAFQGRTPREAYFVKCGRDTTTPADVDRGVVNIHVGFAPLRPAEFVVLRIQQISDAGTT